MKRIKRTIEYFKLKSLIKDELKKLDYSEKAVLREFYIQNKNTIDLVKDDSAVVGLINKGIIYQSGELGTSLPCGIMLPFSMNKLARQLLTFRMIDYPENPNQE